MPFDRPPRRFDLLVLECDASELVMAVWLYRVIFYRSVGFLSNTYPLSRVISVGLSLKRSLKRYDAEPLNSG